MHIIRQWPPLWSLRFLKESYRVTFHTLVRVFSPIWLHHWLVSGAIFTGQQNLRKTLINQSASFASTSHFRFGFCDYFCRCFGVVVCFLLIIGVVSRCHYNPCWLCFIQVFLERGSVTLLLTDSPGSQVSTTFERHCHAEMLLACMRESIPK